MKKPFASLCLLLIFLPAAQWLSAQTKNDAVAVWLLPGVSWKVAKKASLLGQAGYSRYHAAGIGYVQGFITVHPNIVLNPGYLYFLNNSTGPEHFLMNGVIAQLPLSKLLIDDRNMLWNRLRLQAKPLHYYRNRLRLVRSFQLGPALAKVYGYNEAFYSFSNSHWMRNRLAMGASYDILRHANIDITYIRQWDRGGQWLHLFFIMGTWKL